MKLTFLGTGSAFTVGDNFQSNMMVESKKGKKLLIDCGSDARHALAKLDLTYADVDAVYISHLHADHSGGLEWLAFTRHFDKRCDRASLFLHESMVKPVWEHQLKAGLKPLGDLSGELTTYFDVHAVKTDFTWEGVHFELVRSMHIQDSNRWVLTHGLIFRLGSKEIFITTDTQFYPDHFMPYYRRADLIFHDCETAVGQTSVHSSYPQLKTLPDEIRAKMWLYHYNPGKLPEAKRDGFLGFVKPRQTFEFEA